MQIEKYLIIFDIVYDATSAVKVRLSDWYV
jgi:hypothetical protein